MNILHVRELGLIQAQIDQMRELDVFSELADLEYLAKLEAKAVQAAELMSVAGKSSKDHLASLDDGLARLHAFTNDFDKKVKAFRDGFAFAPSCSQLELKEGLDLMGSLWRDFENDLSSVDESFVELDWSEDESAGGKVFCKFLQSYDHLKNGDRPSLVLSEDLKNYLAEPSKFKQDCLREIRRAKVQAEKLLEEREQIISLLGQAKGKWEQGDVDATAQILKQVSGEQFSDVDYSLVQGQINQMRVLDGFSELSDLDELRKSLSLHKQLDSRLIQLRYDIRIAFKDLKGFKNASVTCLQTWESFASKLHDFTRRSSVLPKPIVETFNLTELKNTISTGFAEAKAEVEKAEAEAEKKLKRNRLITFLALVALAILSASYYFAIHLPRLSLQARMQAEEIKVLAERMKENFPVKQPFAVPSSGTEMLWVEPGTFTMGSPSSENFRMSDETQHTVTLTEGYWLGKYEVTQAQWEKVMGDNPSYFKGANRPRPVESVTWTDITSFCEKLTELEREADRLPAGMAYQLPTEAQWEYACRAGTTTAYAFGDTLTSDQANIEGGPRKSKDVGEYPANGWGFHDMHGNVLEWCADWYGKYPGGAVTDPVGTSGSHRVFRGGSWFLTANFARSALRGRYGPARSSSYLGCRLSLRPASQ